MVPAQPSMLRGITFKVGSVVVFTLMAVLIKAAGQVPPGQVVFFRSFFAIFPILAFFALVGGLRTALRAKDPLGHAWRGMVGVLAMACGFYAIATLPLPEATALGFASPLFVVLLSALVLREKVRAHRWSAVAAGLVGVLIICWPQLSFGAAALSASAAAGTVAALAGAFLAAIAMLLVRRLVRSEATPTIVIWFSISATVLSLFSVPFGWVALEGRQMLMLAAAGVLGGIAQIMLTESYRHAEASVLAPFEYVSILLASFFGFIVFAEVPTSWTIAGSALVIAAGVFIIWRERRLGVLHAPVKAASQPLN
jgi:drug/metabolite transporter (DMT)-like permease